MSETKKGGKSTGLQTKVIIGFALGLIALFTFIYLLANGLLYFRLGGT